MDALLLVLNVLVVGIVALLWLAWKRARYRTPEIKRALLELSLGLAGLIGIFDLACYLHSKLLGWVSIVFFFVMFFLFARDANKVVPRVLVSESERSCEKITLKSMLFSKSYFCLIELSRRTSVDFAISVYYLLIVAVLVPVIGALLYFFSWYTGVLLLLWFPIPTTLGFSLLVSVISMAPTVYMMRKNLLKIRARELSESKLT
ncbi:hypothetical protein [Thermococcus sp.]|uniref:hypothetical protein n=1 Tax=Thermococcus sp. TaxID=35749 RepID=UPI0026346493|nr:hypothetical protein [Thermococcus sp.]